MNKRFLSILLAGTILSAGTSFAQFVDPAAEMSNTVEAGKIEKMKHFDQKHHQKMARKMAKDLSLSDEQQAQADKIREDGREKIKPLMDQMLKLRQQIDQERRKNMEDFEKILTPQQKERFEEMKRRGPREFSGRPDKPGMRPFGGHLDGARMHRPRPEHDDRGIGRFPHHPGEYGTPDDPEDFADPRPTMEPRHMMRGMHPVAPENMPVMTDEELQPDPAYLSGADQNSVAPASRDQDDRKSRKHGRRDFRFNKHDSGHDKPSQGGYLADAEAADTIIEADQGGFIEE